MKAKKIRKAIEQAFDIQALSDICQAPISWFGAYGDRVDFNSHVATPEELKEQGWTEQAIEHFRKSCARTERGERCYFYKDNGSNTLAVAHLDTVQKRGWCELTQLSHDTLVFSPKLDDRLGAYVILELLPKLGINVDVLLTTDEESSNSTAMEFKTQKQYNWMVEFDRAGRDAVLYQYQAATPTFVIWST
jgi:hypothetical protein